VGRDIELFVLGGSIPQLKRLFAVLVGKVALPKIGIDRSQAGVSHGEIRIELNCALVEGRGGKNLKISYLLDLAPRRKP